MAYWNRTRSASDCQHVDCQPFRDALSARLDGELSALELMSLDAHLATCPDCRAHEGALDVLHRRLRVRIADPVPDLSARIVAKAHPPQPGRGEWVRWALLTVALIELVLAVPALLLGDDAGASTHVARHLGSLTVAMAVGLAYVAWRPVRAYGLLPVAVALAAAMVTTALIDISDGNVRAVTESSHVLQIAGLWLLWRLAGRPRPAWPRRGRPASAHAW